MQNKKKIKIGSNRFFLITLFIVVIILSSLFFIYYIQTKPSSNTTYITGLTSTTTVYSDTKKDIPINSNTKFSTYYASIDSDFSSNFQLDNILVTSHTELKRYLIKCIGTNVFYIKDGETKTLITHYFDEKFFENNNLAIVMYDASSSQHSYSIASVIENGVNGTINIKDNYYKYGNALAPRSILISIPLDKEIKNVNFDIYRTTTNSYISNFKTLFIVIFFNAIPIIIFISVFILKDMRHNLNISNLGTSLKKHNAVKEILIVFFIAILILIIIFYAIMFCKVILIKA